MVRLTFECVKSIQGQIHMIGQGGIGQIQLALGDTPAPEEFVAGKTYLVQFLDPEDSAQMNAVTLAQPPAPPEPPPPPIAPDPWTDDEGPTPPPQPEHHHTRTSKRKG